MYRRDDEIERSVLVMASKGRVQGLDRASGEVRWEVVVTDQVDRYTNAFAVELLVTATRVYAASWMSNDLVCVAYPSGQELGRVTLPLSTRGRPVMVVDGDQLFVARNGQVAALTLDGQPQWTQTFGHEGQKMVPTALGFPGNVRQADDRYER